MVDLVNTVYAQRKHIISLDQTYCKPTLSACIKVLKDTWCEMERNERNAPFWRLAQYINTIKVVGMGAEPARGSAGPAGLQVRSGLT
jgi:hypothetical protein